MPRRPLAVAFDVIETTFSLDSLRPLLAARGLPATALEVWFARTLRDAFALAATDSYAAFGDIAAATLAEVAREYGRALAAGEIDAILAGFGQLQAQPDAAEAFHLLRTAGIRVAALRACESFHSLRYRNSSAVACGVESSW